MMSQQPHKLAFPQSIAFDEDNCIARSDEMMNGDGMTLRDYFAIRIMVALMNKRTPAAGKWQDHLRECAIDAYNVADVMIKEREV